MGKIFLDGFQPAFQCSGGTGGGQRPAAAVLQADAGAIEQGAHAACQPAIFTDDGDRLPAGQQPLTHLQVDGARLLFRGAGGQYRKMPGQW